MLVFLNYKVNCFSFYSILVDKAFGNIEIDILQCETNKITLKRNERVRAYYIKEHESINIFFSSNKSLFKHINLILFEEFYTFNLDFLIKIIFCRRKFLNVFPLTFHDKT